MEGITVIYKLISSLGSYDKISKKYNELVPDLYLKKIVILNIIYKKNNNIFVELT